MMQRVLLALFCITVSSARKLTNVTVYRLTPINYTGVTNMDTGDAAGDVMFGLNQLLLPQLCPAEPDFTWCANRQYLSGGSAKMVYTEFVVETDTRFGDYNACNPNPKTGIFECETWDASSKELPKQCASGFDIFHEDCLKGTILHSFGTGSSSLPDAQAKCCAACSAEGKHCGGWNLMPGKEWSCQILANDQQLTEWKDAQKSVGCKAAQADPDSYACWYTDPSYNETFADVCSIDECSCDAISNRSMGREQHAMCWDHQSSPAPKTAVEAGPHHHSKWFGYIEGLACVLDGTWFSTKAQGECHGPSMEPSCWWRLAATHRTVNSSCVDDHVVDAVRERRPECWAACPQPFNKTTACYLDCLFSTMLGNSTLGIKPMTKEQIAEPFAAAFLPENQGGCPAVTPRKEQFVAVTEQNHL